MNILKPRALYTAVAIALPASALSVSITIEDDPVNYGTRAKPNVLLVVDDSGSMDVETGVTGTHEGFGYWNVGEESFVSAGKPGSNDGTTRRFTHLFPLGMTADSETTSADIYDGKHIWVENILPPLDAYGFFRHADWNPAYYNPAITYDPWPSYAGHVWPDIDPKKTWYDAGLVGGTTDNYLDLTVGTTKATADFDYFSGMWCYDSTSYCPTTSGAKPTEYWAATYYVDDTTSTFTVDKTLSIDTILVNSADAIVLEAESGTLSGVDVVDSDSAGQGKYVEFNAASTSLDTPPTTNEAALNFSTAATSAEIWVRRRMPDSGSDSFWVSLDGHDSTSISTSWQGDWSGDWHKWWQGHTNSTGFIWEQWGTATLDGTGSYTLRIRQREDGVGLDQVAIVVGTSPTFTDSRPLTNKSTGDTYSCADANDLKPGNYTDFHNNPQWFSGVDAFGPDGRCLERVEIKSTRTDYPSGRTYTQELQNFANWFTYHRKRHQATRGALGSALQGIGSIRAGLFWINNRRTIEMFDLDLAAKREALLDDNYYYIGGSGKSTPNKEALVHAGEQLDSNTDIIQYACQKNYALHFTDGYTSGGSSASVGNADGSAGAPYQDTVSNSLADVAYHYYTSIPWENNDGTTKFDKGKVPVPESCADGTAEPWVDCRTELHMNTYTVGLGLTGQQVFQQSDGTISGVYESVKDAHNVAPDWPTSIGFNGTAVDDLYHAAVNGRGEIFSADNPTELKDQLQSAMRAILAAEGSASGLTFNTATLSTKSLIFSAKFNTTNWTGELTATNLDPETGIPEDTAWSVQEVLDKQASRSIITYDSTTRAGIPFQWSNLQTALLDDDLRVAPDGNPDGNGELRLKYLRGDRSNEGTLFRERSSLLGDIVNSSPVYVGPAVMGWPSHATNSKFGSATDNYSDFAVNKADVRTPMVYVSANDGMVHGFNASDSNAAGREEIAYIPSAIYSTEITKGLHYLTDPDYEHRFYVDGEPVYSDVYVTAKGDSTKSWRTILAGAYRGGAKGLYALDITDPSTFAEGNAAKQVLFEYGPDTDTTLTGSDPDLGYLHEPPLIGMLNNGEWAIIFGNGFNSTNGEGAIYVGYLDKIIKDGWKLDVTYKKFKTNRAGAISGLTGIDTGSDKVIDMIYASDAAGHIWRLDLEDTSVTGWGFSAGTATNPDPLFTATNAADEAQPILVRPRVVKRTLVGATGGGTTTEPDRLVIFGTGQMLQDTDLSNKSVQSFYVFHDRDLSNLSRANLSESTMTQTGTMRDVENTSVWKGAEKDGFYVDFDVASEAGERVIDYIDIRRNSQLEYYALFSTVIPEDDPCSYGGRSWVMAIDLASGGTTDGPIFDTNGDGVVDDKDEATAGMGTDNFLVDLVSAYGVAYGNTSEGNIETFVIDEGAQLTEGRLGWQELINRN